MDNLAKMSRVQKMTFSAMVMAMYIVILYFTQSFSFGAYQIRIATALYAYPKLFFRGISDPYCHGPVCPCLSISVPGFTPWSRQFYIKYVIRRIRHRGYAGRLYRRHDSSGLYRADPQEKLEQVPDRCADHTGTWSGSSYLSVIFPFHALSADGGKSLRRTAGSIYCGSNPGESSGKGNLSGENSGNPGKAKHRTLTMPAGEHSPAGKIMNCYGFKE